MIEDAVDPLTPRQLNHLRIIEALYRRPGTSRTELARLAGLSRPTVSGLVEELERAGVVEENDNGEAVRPRTTGRPPIPLSLVAEAAFALGLDFGRQHIRVAICNLAGKVIAEDWSPAQVDHASIVSLDLALELVLGALRSANIGPERLLGVGMGLAAPINKVTSELEANGILPGWHAIDPAAEMRTRLRLPITVDNDANLGALGEKMFGAGGDVDSLVYVRLSAGIGAGVILRGRLYQGCSGVAGEIGHILSDESGLICRCGNRGCLETVASTVAVGALLERSTGQPVSAQRMLELVKAGDRGARRAVACAGESVGVVIATIVNLLNPELVIVGGDLASAGDIMLDPIRAAIARHSVGPAAAAVRVTAGALGDRAGVLGAAGLILDRVPRALAQRMA